MCNIEPPAPITRNLVFDIKTTWFDIGRAPTMSVGCCYLPKLAAFQAASIWARKDPFRDRVKAFPGADQKWLRAVSVPGWVPDGQSRVETHPHSELCLAFWPRQELSVFSQVAQPFFSPSGQSRLISTLPQAKFFEDCKKKKALSVRWLNHIIKDGRNLNHCNKTCSLEWPNFLTGQWGKVPLD